MKRFTLVFPLSCLLVLCLAFSTPAKRKRNHTVLPQVDRLFINFPRQFPQER